MGLQREGVDGTQTETSEKLDWVSVILMKWAVEIIEKARYSDQKDTGGNLKKENNTIRAIPIGLSHIVWTYTAVDSVDN